MEFENSRSDPDARTNQKINLESAPQAVRNPLSAAGMPAPPGRSRSVRTPEPGLRSGTGRRRGIKQTNFMKEYNFKINGNDYTVGIEILNDTEADVIVNGASYSVEVLDTTVKPSVAAKPQVAAVPASHPVQPSTVPVTKPAAAAPAAAGESPVKSPLPGVILDIRIKEGDTVAVGQTLVVLEAMKMENNIDSDRAGVVKSIKVNRGDSVLEGDVLITLG